MPIRARTAAFLLFGSGFCALVYQTAWLRDFRLIFGASTAASAAVLGVFMAGLGFGGIILGARVEKSTRPLAFYGFLELIIAASAAISPLLIFLARQCYMLLGGTTVLGMTVGTIVRLIMAALIMGVPTFLMGGTLPAVARAVVSREDTSRRAVGILYGVNTLGAVTGALAGTFYLFENFGNHVSLWWASALNIIVALLAIRFSNTGAPSPVEATGWREVSDSGMRLRTAFLLLAAGAVGFAFLLMEMVWYRMLAPLFGGSTFSFGLILAIALFGIGFGGVLYSRSGARRSASVTLFALTCAAEALFIAIPYALGDRIAIAAMLLRPLGTLGFYGHVIAWAALCSIIILPAALVSGFQFPLLISLLGTGRTRIGSQTGAAYAWNTIGALIGSLAGGFGFMPMFSAPGVWRLVVCLLALVAVIAALVAVLELKKISRAILPASLAGVAVVLLLATGPTAFWRHSQIGIGVVREYHSSTNELRGLINLSRRHILWEADGLESSVAVADGNSLAFVVNGKSDGNAKTDAGTQVMSGMIGAALHPNPESAMVVGLGTGSTAGWLAAVPTMKRVDVVELEGSILRVAKDCAPINQNALSNPKLHVTIGDGREILLTTPRKYDLIVSEPSNPYRAGVAGLFTREFYQSIEKRLAAGGMFLQWMQTYDVDDRTIQIFYRTLGSVFPNVESWQTEEGDLLVVATREPVTHNATALRQRLANEPLKSAMHGAWHAEGLEEFLAHYVANNNVAREMQNLEQLPLNTDDRTVIEFAFARCVSATNVFHLPSLRAAARTAGCDRPKIEGAVDWSLVREAQLSSDVVLSSAEPFQSVLDKYEKTRAAAFVRYQNGQLEPALGLWKSQPAEPRTFSEFRLVAECLAEFGDPNASKYIDRVARSTPVDAEAMRATLLLKQGKADEAAKVLENFLRTAQHDGWPDQSLIQRSLARAETVATLPGQSCARAFYDLLSKPLAVWNCDGERMSRLITLGLHLDSGKPGAYTAAAVTAYEPYVFWGRKFLEIRKSAYEAVNDPRAGKAARDLDDFVTNQAFTADTAALSRVFASASHPEGGYATEGRKKKAR